jgi:AmmeMemoRadiSam system protein B
VLETLWGGPETRIVVSSDLSHYLPYAEGRYTDERTARRIASLDSKPITPDEACGCGAINGLLHVARGRRLRGEIIDLRSSGDTAGPRTEVVGYGAFAFYEEATDAN